jgi:hypothetical protein
LDFLHSAIPSSILEVLGAEHVCKSGEIDDIHEEEFTQLLVSYLFRQGPSNERPQQGSSMKERPVAISRH